MRVIGSEDLERGYAQRMYVAIVGSYYLGTILAFTRQRAPVVGVKHGAMIVPSCPPRP